MTAAVLVGFGIQNRRSGWQRAPRTNVILDTFMLWAQTRYGRHEHARLQEVATVNPRTVVNAVAAMNDLAALNEALSRHAGVAPELPERVAEPLGLAAQSVRGRAISTAVE
jgi:hypothetical protein